MGGILFAHEADCEEIADAPSIWGGGRDDSCLIAESEKVSAIACERRVKRAKVDMQKFGEVFASLSFAHLLICSFTHLLTYSLILLTPQLSHPTPFLTASLLT